MSSQIVENKPGWSIADSDRLYKIKNWGASYYSINATGNIAVSPRGENSVQIDLKQLVDDLKKRNIRPPVLIRFMDIFSDRIRKLYSCFENARKTFEYSGNYYPVYPIKVNQQRHVVEAMIQEGRNYNLGLEVGSKPELLAVLALSPDNHNLVICNGYKDEEFIETALYAKRVGKTVILVVDQYHEIEKIVTIAKRINVIPSIGIRVKLLSKGEGRWADTAGDNSKFGLRINELLRAVNYLIANNMSDAFELIHFHIGSQISHIQNIKVAMTEISRIYAALVKMGLKITYVDVGGGLGVDYDGTSSRNTFSTNYNPQEYANDVIYSLKAICDADKISHPNIISESGRALTAHSSILIANVIDYTKPRSASSFTDPLSPKCTELLDMFNQLKVENCREYYHDTLYARREALNLFNMGYMTLEERSKIEELYWSIMEKINALRKQHNLNYHEFDGLDKILASTYVLNFSLFQSLPDCWAIDQVFPVVPIHRLNEKPDVFCSVADITCDSDGRVVHYIGDEEPSNILPLHGINHKEDYFIGFFLVGAYQEILGDLHNLFGDTNAVHITLDNDNQYRISHHIKGDTVNEVLSYLEYYAKELVELMRKKLEISVNSNKTSVEDAAHFLNYFESGLTGYTYLED